MTEVFTITAGNKGFKMESSAREGGVMIFAILVPRSKYSSIKQQSQSSRGSNISRFDSPSTEQVAGLVGVKYSCRP